MGGVGSHTPCHFLIRRPAVMLLVSLDVIEQLSHIRVIFRAALLMPTSGPKNCSSPPGSRCTRRPPPSRWPRPSMLPNAGVRSFVPIARVIYLESDLLRSKARPR